MALDDEGVTVDWVRLYKGSGDKIFFEMAGTQAARALPDFSGGVALTEVLARRTLALPFYNTLSEEQVAYVCDVLADAGRIL